MKKSDKQFAQKTVLARTMQQLHEMIHSSPDVSAASIINDTLFQEQQRLKKEQKRRGYSKQRKLWDTIGKTFQHASDAERTSILESIISSYTDEIMGDFSPQMYSVITKIVPHGLHALSNRFSPFSYLKTISNQTLNENLIISGNLDRVKTLGEKGTLIIAPNHLSNLDSVMIGYAMYLSNLPPVTYGAGLNLFSNAAISFLLSNLGAYKVDRKKKNNLYKTVLKNYAQLTLELGNHNLFFPGGTRNRRGEMNQKLKLGLLGCAINAYIANLLNNKQHPKIFVIPCTINYGLVLEAETLIDDYLKDTGKSRYIITDDESSKLTKIVSFLKNVRTMHSRIHIHFDEPLDPFGNAVDNEGESMDRHGRKIDIQKYVETNNTVGYDEQRDREYTKYLGQTIVERHNRSNVIMSTNITSFVLYTLIGEKHKNLDLYHLLASDNTLNVIPLYDVLRKIEALMKVLTTMHEENKLIIDPAIITCTPVQIFDNAYNHFNTFHGKKVINRKDDNIYTKDLRLIYYYRNKLDHYHVERKLLHSED